MNYQKIYDDLIESARSHPAIGLKERHHIFPRCLGGNDDKDNLVDLSPRQHYVAHQLLVKIYPEHHGLKYAAYMMTIAPKGKRSSNRLYGWLRESYFKNRPQSRGMTGMKHSEETKEKMRKARSNQVLSEETKLKISQSKTGAKMSRETRRSMNEKRRNHPTWLSSFQNRSMPDSAKEAIGLANRGRKFPDQTCHVCGKTGAGPNMKRYHFDNCKY